MKRDVPATLARKFLDKRSYVAQDGREVLTGLGNKDWFARKEELWERAGGRCEFIIYYGEHIVPERCTAVGVIPAHIQPRYPRRDDRMDNLKLYCVPHDRLTEKQSWRKVRWSKREG